MFRNDNLRWEQTRICLNCQVIATSIDKMANYKQRSGTYHQTVVVTSAHLLKRNVAQKSSLFSWPIPCQSIQGSTCIIIIIYPVPSVMLCPS